MLTEAKITKIFCIANDFCKVFDAQMAKYTVKSCSIRKYHHDYIRFQGQSNGHSHICFTTWAIGSRSISVPTTYAVTCGSCSRQGGVIQPICRVTESRYHTSCHLHQEGSFGRDAHGDNIIDSTCRGRCARIKESIFAKPTRAFQEREILNRIVLRLQTAPNMLMRKEIYRTTR